MKAHMGGNQVTGLDSSTTAAARTSSLRAGGSID
jgi:hypothetical protein